MFIKIRKAKVKESSVELVFIETDNEKFTSEITGRYSHPPHKDLMNAMKNLVKHLVVLCDLKEADALYEENFYDFDVDRLSQFKVTGISIGGDDENEGVVITGLKTLPNGKVLNLNSPFTKFMDEHNSYDFEDELFNDIARCIEELREYKNGKWAVMQLEMHFEKEGA